MEYKVVKRAVIGNLILGMPGDILDVCLYDGTVINTSTKESFNNLNVIKLKDCIHGCCVIVSGDAVNYPPHYADSENGIECIDAMIAAYGKESVMSFCKCNAFKYLFRFEKKNGIEDIRKAQWYQNKYIELKNGKTGNT